MTVLGAAALPDRPARAQDLTQDQALALAFPQADRVERRTAYLDPDQIARVAKGTGPGGEEPGGIVTHYVAFRGDRPLGVAYFDAHRVRTLDQVLMIVVGPEDAVLRVETIRFREPPEYRAPGGWLDLFKDRSMGPELSLKGEIPNITGATLTAGAVTRAVRRALAIHREVSPFQDGQESKP